MKSHFFYKLCPLFQKRVCLFLVYTLFVKLKCSTVMLSGLNDFLYAEVIKIFVISGFVELVFDFPYSK